MSDETMTAEDCIAEITFAMTGRPPLFITQGGAHKALARYVQQQIERQDRDASLLAPYEAFVRAVKGCGSGAWNDPKFVTAVLALDNAVLALKQARKGEGS